MRYIVSGGGTGGHIYPALSIIEKIKEKDLEAEILYVGTEKGLESKIVPPLGIPFKTIQIQGFKRKLGKDTIKSALMIFKGLSDAKKIIRDFRPDVVIGTGGYVCGPVVYQGAKFGAKTMIHEQNAFPGMTNRILGKRVDKIAISFKESENYFKKEKITLTGNPIRNVFISEMDKEKCYELFQLDANKKTILCFGGSNGQKSLNDSVLGILNQIEKRDDLQLLHITGQPRYEHFIERVQDLTSLKNTSIRPYLHEMAEALTIADVVIISAGALTLAEVTAKKVPSIVVPKAYTTENHQEFNARAIETAGAGFMVLEKDLNSEVLYDKINAIIRDEKLFLSMKAANEKIRCLDASEKIYGMIESMINNGKTDR